MKTSTKGYLIFIVTLISILGSLPTLFTFLPVSKTSFNSQIQNLQQRKNDFTVLQNFDLALPDKNKNRIELMTTKKNFSLKESNIFLKPFLKDFTLKQDGDHFYLILKANSKAFLSKKAEALTSLFTNSAKVKSVSLDKSKAALILTMKQDKRLAKSIEPLKSLLLSHSTWNSFLATLGATHLSLDALYHEATQSYVISSKKPTYAVNLGLDLQGGMYLDIGVETNKLFKKILTETADNIEDKLLDEAIGFDHIIVSPVTSETHQIIVPIDKDEAVDFNTPEYESILARYDVNKTDKGYVFSLKQSEIDFIKKNTIDQALDTIRNRIDQLGVKEPSIQKRGEDSIVIQLPGLQDPNQARKVIGQVAVLQFMLLADKGSVEKPTKDQLVLQLETRDPITKELLSSRPTLLEKKVYLTGDMVSDARVQFLPTGQASVSLTFNDKGSEIFADLTGKNVGRQLAIVLDNKVQSAPRLNEKISGGRAQITGNFSPEEATDLALVLRSGSLPAPIIIHEERTIGASLGADSIKKAAYALLFAFFTVMVFMFIYYNLAGIFSIIALCLNCILILAALAYFQATLTLPGMAGIVLTIGMAVDANVLIFERIREEIAIGTALRSAIHIGYDKATLTIIDSNVTTMLAAIILFQFGTGPIKGFAVTLSIGILASMFTAIVVTKFFFEIFYVNRKNITKISI